MISFAHLVERRSRAISKLDFLLGNRLLQQPLFEFLKSTCKKGEWDIAWVDSGWWCGPKILQYLKSIAPQVVLLCNDDPMGGRETYHWKQLVKSISRYDLCATFREPTAVDFQNAGAADVLRLRFGYDEFAHDPSTGLSEPVGDFESEVCFVGTRMEDRGDFLLRLVQLGVPLSIWGNGWESRSVSGELKKHLRGRGIANSKYIAAITRSKVCVGMLSKGNRDLHTQRSLEIPYAGGLLCAPRTSEHLDMYADGKEAVFYDSAEECARLCHELLADPERRRDISEAGSKRVRELGVGNEQMVGRIIERLAEKRGRTSP